MGVTPKEDSLFEALRQVRTEISRRTNAIAYHICDNKTLTDMAMKRPHSREELLRVYGMGQVKADRFGNEFLQAIVKWEREHHATAQASVTERRSRSARVAGKLQTPQGWTKPESEMLRRAYLSGVTISQLASIHNRSEQDIRRQLKHMNLLFDVKTVESYGISAYMADDEYADVGEEFPYYDEEDDE